MITLQPLFKLTIVCWFVFDRALNYCQQNPFTIQVANRWNGIDMPGCQCIKGGSTTLPLEADDDEMLDEMAPQLTSRLSENNNSGSSPNKSPRTLPAMARLFCGVSRWTWENPCSTTTPRQRKVFLSELSLSQTTPASSRMMATQKICLESMDIPWKASIHCQKITWLELFSSMQWWDLSALNHANQWTASLLC